MAAETVSAVPAVPMLPAVDVTFNVGVDINPEPVFVMLAFAARVTELSPYIAPLRANAPAEVRLTAI